MTERLKKEVIDGSKSEMRLVEDAESVRDEGLSVSAALDCSRF